MTDKTFSTTSTMEATDRARKFLKEKASLEGFTTFSEVTVTVQGKKNIYSITASKADE